MTRKGSYRYTLGVGLKWSRLVLQKWADDRLDSRGSAAEQRPNGRFSALGPLATVGGRVSARRRQSHLFAGRLPGSRPFEVEVIRGHR